MEIFDLCETKSTNPQTWRNALKVLFSTDKKSTSKQNNQMELLSYMIKQSLNIHCLGDNFLNCKFCDSKWHTYTSHHSTVQHSTASYKQLSSPIAMKNSQPCITVKTRDSLEKSLLCCVDNAEPEHHNEVAIENDAIHRNQNQK